MHFSPQKTKDPDLQFQVTDQIAKDFAKLHLGQGLDLSFNTYHHGMSPFAIIPLSQEVHRKREVNERAIELATSTTLEDYKEKKKFIPMLDLTFLSLRILLKCLLYWLME